MVGKHGLALKSRRVFPNEWAQSAVGGAATFNIAAPNRLSVVLSGFEWSYDAAPTGGRIRIICNGQEYVNFDVTSSGAGFQDYDPPIRFASGEGVSLIIDAAGAAVTGKIRPKAHWVE